MQRMFRNLVTERMRGGCQRKRWQGHEFVTRVQRGSCGWSMYARQAFKLVSLDPCSYVV